jgi:integrase
VNTLSYTDGLSGQTVKNIFLNLSAALEKARKLKMIPENPCVDVVLPHIKKYEAQVYNAEKVKEVLELAKGTDMYLILVIGFYLGLRKGEVAALKWSDIDLANGIVHIRESRVRVDNNVITKSPKSAAVIRDLWLGKEACDVFREEYARYLESSKVHGFSKQGYVVCRLDGEPFAPDSIPQKWERFREAHNLPKIRFHDLRHTCATLMLANGVDAKTAQTRLGHSNIQITLNTYAHCLPAMNKAAGDKLDSILVNK